MALLRHHEAYRQWSTLLEAVEQMVDWVHFTATVDTFNSVLAPKLVETIACFSACVDPDTGVNLGAELDQFLRERHRWSGAQFDVHVNAVDLLSSLKSFRVVSEKPLGKGAYSRVMLARSLLTGETIVHKHVQLESAEHGMPLHVLRELALLKKMSHPHVVRLYDVLYRPTEVILTLEFLDCNLRELVRDTGGLSITFVKSFTHQILQGLAYLKAKRCIHRDLKPANVLVLPRQGVVKIADFGLGRSHDLSGGRYTRQVMTLRYRAPEIMLGIHSYDAAVDIWSVGCIMAEMLLGDTPFQGNGEVDQLMKIFEALGRPDPAEWPQVAHCENFHHSFPRWPRPASLAHLAPGLDELGLQLLSAMFEYDPAKRITADEALAHPWFHDVQLPAV